MRGQLGPDQLGVLGELGRHLVSLDIDIQPTLSDKVIQSNLRLKLLWEPINRPAKQHGEIDEMHIEFLLGLEDVEHDVL